MSDGASALRDATARILPLWKAAFTGEGERRQRHQRRMALAWAAACRYRTYLDIALEERRMWGERLISNLAPEGAAGRATDEWLAERGDLELRTHYAIECFFLFSKILLDRVALAIRETFGHARDFEPSHGALLKESTGLRAFAQQHRIEPPPRELLAQARQLEDVTSFRDHQIVHPTNVRHGRVTQLIPTTGEVDVLVGVHMPKDGESPPAESPIIAEVVPLLDEYLAGVSSWVAKCLAELAESS